MPTPITAAAFAAGVATLLGLNSGDTTTLTNLVLAWDPTSPSDLAQLIEDFVTNAGQRDSSINSWLTGTSTGGPAGDGYFEVGLFGGGTVLLPSPAKYETLLAHGADAQTGLAFSIIGPFNANELLQLVSPPGDIVINPALISGWARLVPTADSIFPVKKSGATWGTVTFKAGSHNDVRASFASDSIIRGDAAMLYAPGSVDATLADFSVTIPGV